MFWVLCTGDLTEQRYRWVWHGPGQELLEGRGFPLCFPWLHPWGLEQHLALKEMAFGGCLMPMTSATWVFGLILGNVLFPLGF